MSEEAAAAPAAGEGATTGGVFSALSGGQEPAADNAAGQQQGTAQSQQQGSQQGSQQGENAPWYNSMPDDIKEYVGHKGFKSAEALARSYQSLEKMNGVPQDELFRIREDMEADDVDKIYKALGRPDDSKNYTLKAGDGDVPELVEWFKGEAFKRGLSDKAMNEMYSEFNEQVQGIANNQMKAVETKNHSEVNDLLKSWGSKADYNKSLVDRAGEHLGLDEDFLKSVMSTGNAAKLMEALSKVGSMMTEKNIVTGETGSSFGKTVSEAKNEMAMLQRDQAFMKSYFDGSSPTHKQSVERMTELNRIIVNSK